MEHLIDILWWALAAGGALLGNFGGGGGGAKEPKLDTAASQKITRADYALKREFIPKLTATAGRADREEYQKNLMFAIGQLNDDRISNRINRAMPEVKATRNAVFRELDSANDPSAEYRRVQEAMRRGVGPQQIGQRSVTAAQGQAAQMDQVRNVRARTIGASTMDDFGAARSRNIQAGQVGSGTLGNTLMRRAQSMARSDGRLSAEAERDAIQATRQGMAARGLATGSAALGAELLNRDRYSRSRMQEDLEFAQGVQSQDLQRQFNNVGSRLTAAQSNQGAAMQAELANLQTRYNAAVQEGNWQQAAAIQNAENSLRSDLANQQTRFSTGQFNAANQQAMNMTNMQSQNQSNQFNATLGSNIDQFNAAQLTDAARYNVGLLGSASQMADVERSRQLGLRQDAYNFALGSNPNMVALGLGSGYANMTGPAIGLMGGQNVQPLYSGGQFSGQGGGGFNMMGAGAGALSGAATGAMLGSVVPGIGTAAGAIGGGLIGGLGGGLSDKREKTDIKPLGTLTNVLKIPAYEYRYKGEKKKRKGVMAQDVQKVLPEAVTEVDYQGKRRLAIKPGVIGAALAEELTNQTKAVAA